MKPTLYQDKGPWMVRKDDLDVYIESDDFTHDVSLMINGDFRNRKEKVRYAKSIAKVLNASVRNTK